MNYILISTVTILGIKWMEGNAETLDAVESNTFDAYTIAFGIRNCTHIDKVYVLLCFFLFLLWAKSSEIF